VTAATAEAAPAPDERETCGEPHPDRRAVRCTREPHQGGHLNEYAGLYWQAEEGS